MILPDPLKKDKCRQILPAANLKELARFWKGPGPKQYPCAHMKEEILSTCILPPKLPFPSHHHPTVPALDPTPPCKCTLSDLPLHSLTPQPTFRRNQTKPPSFVTPKAFVLYFEVLFGLWLLRPGPLVKLRSGLTHNSRSAKGLAIQS